MTMLKQQQTMKKRQNESRKSEKVKIKMNKTDRPALFASSPIQLLVPLPLCTGAFAMTAFNASFIRRFKSLRVRPRLACEIAPGGPPVGSL
jgi:hypothetical protein